METFSFLKKDTFNIDNKRIIKSDDYLEYIKAQDIITRAKQEAERIKQEARLHYEQERQRGYEDGLMEGKMAITEQMMENVSKTVDYFSSIEDKVVDTVIIALKKIIGEMHEKDLIMGVVRNALSVVRMQKQVTLRVCPSQKELVQTEINNIIAEFPGISFLDVVPDTRLKEGGCIIETDIGVVDASINTQLEAIKKSLSKVFRK
jgi:type III secretion protein L